MSSPNVARLGPRNAEIRPGVWSLQKDEPSQLLHHYNSAVRCLIMLKFGIG